MFVKNKEWTPEEELELIKSVRKKIPMEEIAVKHNRDINSIEFRLRKIIYENITENGHDIKKISMAFNMLQDDVLKKYEYYKNLIGRKNINLSNTKFNDETNEKHHFNINDIERKMEKLEKENKLIKVILENNELHRKLNEEINNKRISKNIKNIIKELRKKN